LEKVVLFGSYARGDYHEDSDIDVMILADIQPEDVDKTRDQIHDLTFYLDLEYNVVICLHIVCSAIFHKYLDTMPFFMNVRKDGVELYA
jgi:predicted nucleotidyltransferase